MPRNPSYFWRQMPFFRLIIPLAAGILLQRAFVFLPLVLLSFAGLFCLLFIIFYLLPIAAKYTLRWVTGATINGLCVAFGALLVFNNDIRNQQNWVGSYTNDNIAILATLQEPLIEKAKTYKALASADAIYIDGEWKEVTGNILLYFGKDSIAPLKYGSQVLFNKPLQPIKNLGNPGSFDYEEYSSFQNIFHQVFLKNTDYETAKTTDESAFKKWLFSVRTSVIQKLQLYIPGEREAGVAEALLIGYRDDLDKGLVQAYSNTGVVHIIAISGMHLGIIYLVLVWLLKPLRKIKYLKWLEPVIILSVLWIFTMLAAGVPSILRSAVMFTFIVLGKTIDRKSSIYNTLAASAFVMLCINPYFLWDAGFQLSYAAVVSIVIFSIPVYNWFYIQNKSIDFFWKLTSVTIAAQILTLPIIAYTFHQFPNLFLLTNCLIVPLSTIILFAEILVLISSYIPAIAKLAGIVTGWLLWCMNSFIEYVNGFPYAVYEGIQNNLAETVLLYVFIAGTAYWLMYKTRQYLFIGLAAMFIFVLIDGDENYQLRQQEKVVVYNIPQHTAVDFIAGKEYAFTGDTAMLDDDYLRNFYLKPSRALYGTNAVNNLPGLYLGYPFIQFKSKRILVVDKPFTFASPAKIALDMIVVSRNPRIRIADLANAFNCRQYVFDGSNSTWKINQWKRDCDSLHLQYFITADNGAYEMNL